MIAGGRTRLAMLADRVRTDTEKTLAVRDRAARRVIPSSVRVALEMLTTVVCLMGADGGVAGEMPAIHLVVFTVVILTFTRIMPAFVTRVVQPIASVMTANS